MMKKKILFILCLSLLSSICLWSSIVWDLLGIHIEIGLHEVSEKDSSLMSQISFLSWFQLITSLDKTHSEGEREKVLNQYLWACQSFSSKLESSVHNEEIQEENYKTKYAECSLNLDYYNNLFKTSFLEGDFNNAHNYAEKIAEIRSCEAKNLTYQKEHQYYKKFYTSQGPHLQKRCDYIAENKSKIIKYYEIMKPDLLKELYKISVTLETNFS